MDITINFFIAFVAGLLSFFSPCIIILVPAFLSHLAGITSVQKRTKNKNAQWAIFLHTIYFCLGFILIFTALGATLGAFSQLLLDFSEWFLKLAGLLIIFFGLVALEIVDIQWFANFSQSCGIKKSFRWKAFSSFFIGGAFAITWTPCIGPILSGILILAMTQGTILFGTLLLLCYSLGLMVPFLITGLCTNWASKKIKKHSNSFHYFNYIAGILLITLGILLFTNNLTKLVSYLFFL